MVFLKEQLEHLVGHQLLEARGDARGIPFDEIKGRTLKAIKTFGKEILFCFDNATIRVHLMLFGKFALDQELNRLLRLGLQFENGTVNFYACECRYITDPLDTVYDWSTDVMHVFFDRQKALEKLAGIPKQLICEALLDQHILAGVGNKIKNEVLFRTQIHPESLVGEIPRNELEKLVAGCVRLSAEYLQWKREGTEDEHWLVYKRSECPRDHIPLNKEKIGKSRRSCYFCDRCQRLYLPG